MNQTQAESAVLDIEATIEALLHQCEPYLAYRVIAELRKHLSVCEEFRPDIAKMFGREPLSETLRSSLPWSDAPTDPADTVTRQFRHGK